MVDLNKMIERVDKEIRVSKRADSSMTLIPVQYAEEILDILKKQEPKKIERLEKNDFFPSCPSCHEILPIFTDETFYFCCYCGQEVLFDV